MNSLRSRAFVGVHQSERPSERGIIYVLIADRAAFELIDLPMTDYGHVVTKSIDAEQLLIFQYWRKP